MRIVGYLRRFVPPLPCQPILLFHYGFSFGHFTNTIVLNLQTGYIVALQANHAAVATAVCLTALPVVLWATAKRDTAAAVPDAIL